MQRRLLGLIGAPPANHARRRSGTPQNGHLAAAIEFTVQMHLGAGCKRCHLLVPNMDPLDLAPTANGIRQTVQAFANDSVDPLDTADSSVSIN